MSSTIEQGSAPPSRPGLPRFRLPHVHRYSWAGDDAFSAHSLYRCRCGVVKPGL